MPASLSSGAFQQRDQMTAGELAQRRGLGAAMGVGEGTSAGEAAADKLRPVRLGTLPAMADEALAASRRGAERPSKPTV